MKLRIGLGLTGLCLSVITVFAFQNCGQSGSINSAAGLDKVTSSGGTSGSDPATDPGSLVVVNPPSDNPPSSTNPPPSDTPPSTTPPVVQNPPSDTPPSGQNPPPTTTPPVVQNPPSGQNPPPTTNPPGNSQPPTASNGNGGDNGNSGGSCNDGGGSEVDPGSSHACKDINAAAVNLAIDYIALPGGMIVLASDTSNFVISSTQKSIKVKALVDADLSEIRLVLKDSGNAIMGNENTYGLKTPSGQQSGIKVMLDNSVSVKKDTMYELTVDVDLNNQIVAAGNKCIFKPVIKSAQLL
jgi:hypothetical protein